MYQKPSQYDHIAVAFSRSHRKWNSTNRSALYRAMRFPMEGKKVLDAGCGDGTDMLHFQQRGARVYGCDVSQELLQIARRKCPGARLEQCSFSNTPFRDFFFDAVYSKYAMQHDADIAAIYREVRRVLKPGGIFVFLVAHPFRQFMEKRGTNYFRQEIVHSRIFGKTLVVDEPSHMLAEYFSNYFLHYFSLLSFREQVDPGTEKIGGCTYPGFFIVKAAKK